MNPHHGGPGRPQDASIRPAPAVRLRQVANWLNLTTPLGLAVATLGRSRLRSGPDGLIVAEGYRLRFPVAGAFTIGDVVTTAATLDALEAATPGVTAHEGRHAWQYAVSGVWFFPVYVAGAVWSLARTGDPAVRNPLERHAGLVTGGYVDAATGAPTNPVVWTLAGPRLRRPPAP